ncbi:acetyl-CoA synthetase-like protein [Zopfia rhizophila CBS 207.26]|uniref:Acetyl-CoA synthetase-like protein n=1 Tax=Zopfia rhizophila CBS 207.26 TaxID=1314779 RepID=A0A6A6EB07_9PEZI|nr:acetyl-CoA synthetase-like protein [Zopfia rhizophila CBS 207.26]
MRMYRNSDTVDVPKMDLLTLLFLSSSGQPAALAIFYGIIAAGGIFSAALPSYAPEESARQIKQGKSTCLLLSRVFGGWGACKMLRGRENDMEEVSDEDELRVSLVALLYGSGTTGVPKGLFIPSGQARAYITKSTEAGEPVPSPFLPFTHLPIAHITGVLGYLISLFYSGGSVYGVPRFGWKLFLHYFKTFKITGFYIVPSIYLHIARNRDVTDHFDRVDTAITGSAPMDTELQQAGLSETTGPVTAMPKGASDKSGCISPVLPNMEMRIVDDNFKDVESSQPGEIIVRGPFVTNGYSDKEEATKMTFNNGWFCTGEIAVDRGGKFYIVDRKKEILKCKAAVVGVRTEGGSEVPTAYVVLRSKDELSDEDVKSCIKGAFAEYKQLRGEVRFVDELPKYAVGKILRRELRERRKNESVKAEL